MIKVLLANMHYPDRYNLWAPWNKLANTAIARTQAVEPEIVVPRPFALPFRFFPHHEMCHLPVTEESAEGKIHYPRFLYLLPKKYFYGASFDFYQQFVGKYVSRNIEKKDLIHSHFVFMDGYGMIRTSKKWGVPLIVDVHGDSIFTHMVRDRLVGRKMTETLQHASKVVCISRNLCNLAKDFGLPEDKIEYVPLGIDIGKYRPEQQDRVKNERGLQDKIVILFVGQLIERKGVRHLLKSLALTEPALLRKCKVVIIGDGADRRHLEWLADKLGLEGLVTFTGKVSDEELLDWYAAADVFVLPSLSEGRPTVINEAMASECAVIASNVSGIPEQVADGCNGFLVPPADPVALARKIAYLLENENSIGIMGRKGREKIVDEKITWEGYAERMVRIYRGVTG
ncbi:MAG: glycosyltransferase [Betaproteobacteria bacterium]